MKKIKLALILVVLAYLGANIYLYTQQDSLIFKNQKAKKVELINNTNIKDISFQVEENINLYGRYKKSSNKNSPLILYFGGSSSDITQFFNNTQNINNYDILSFNYRGFINSQGNPSEEKIFYDALNIYDTYTKNREVILVGKSLGTGVATYLASKRKNKALILITPYDSISAIAKNKYPIFPIDLLLKHKFESIKYIQNVTSPVGLFEVKGDLVIKKAHFDNLKSKIKNTFAYEVLDDVSHAKVLTHKNFEIKLKEMLEKINNIK